MTRGARTLLVLALYMIAAGCGGNTPDGSGSLDPGTASVVLADEAGIRANLAGSNANWSPFGMAGKLKRWNVEATLIPLNLKGSAIAVQAADLIESKLEMTLFDRGDYTVGLIINEGAGDEWCGNVSNVPGGRGLTFTISGTGEISGTYYINVGNPTCVPTPAIYAHEFGHALGLGGHFAGFYDNVATRTPSIDGNFWNTLYTLYHNPVGTDISGAVVFLPEVTL